MTSQYQKEADKCNSGMETCEEAREKAEATLAAQKKLTAMWETEGSSERMERWGCRVPCPISGEMFSPRKRPATLLFSLGCYGMTISSRLI
ncbi:hypothetical protein OIU84_016709 [Salix udensis]|uniref:Uncharacterized protein n=1 Tax=Salix udensis TaxID=889485 RepID=A0AAD6NQ35_9ROSI|nr:hypothetical protein OIU84_016709 [Salix udensis]